MSGLKSTAQHVKNVCTTHTVIGCTAMALTEEISKTLTIHPGWMSLTVKNFNSIIIDIWDTHPTQPVQNMGRANHTVMYAQLA